jgi:mRNA-degrading endonuclease YafQ of YafQ-DinJ toxin-antitoxin module
MYFTVVNVLIQKSNALVDSITKYQVTKEELEHFVKEKVSNPLGAYSKGHDSSYVHGPLKDTKCRHAKIRSDLRIVYRISGANPTILYLYCFCTHDETGTGTPRKPKNSKSFAKRLNNMGF